MQTIGRWKGQRRGWTVFYDLVGVQRCGSWYWRGRRGGFFLACRHWRTIHNTELFTVHRGRCTRRIRPPLHVDDLGRFMGGGGMMLGVISHLESHFHVMWGATASHSLVEVVARGRGDEVVVLAGGELHAPRGGGEGAKGDSEIHELMGLVAYCNHSRVRLSDATGLELIFGHAVNNRLFFVLMPQIRFTWGLAIDWTNDVHLVVLPRLVAWVDVNDMVGIINAKDRVGSVPVDVMGLFDSLDAAHKH